MSRTADASDFILGSTSPGVGIVTPKRRGVGAGNNINSQTAIMGALDLAAFDGFQIIDKELNPVTGCTDDGTGTASGFSLSAGGLVSASTDGSLSAQNGNTIDITCDQGSATITLDVRADTYVIGDGELSTVIAEGDTAIDGKTIAGRPGADIGGTSVGDTVAISNSYTFSSGITIEPLDSDNPCHLRRISFAQDGPVTIQNVLHRDDFDLAADLYGNNPLVRFKNNSTGRSSLTYRYNRMFSVEEVENFDTSAAASGTAAAHTGGVSSVTITLTNSPDLSAVEAASTGTYSVLIGSTLRKVISANDAADTIEVQAAMTISAGSPQNYAIGLTPPFVRGFGADGGITNAPDIVFEDCHLHDLERGFTSPNVGFRSMDFNRNLIEKCYADATTLSITGTETLWRANDNVFYGGWGSPGDPLNPHVDGLQGNLGTMTQNGSIVYEAVGNRFYPKDAADFMQSIFFENGGSFSIKVKWLHNMTSSNAFNCFNLENAQDGSLIGWSTGGFDTDNPGAGGLVPNIRIENEIGKVAVFCNAMAGYSWISSPNSEEAEAGNHTFSPNNTDGGQAAVLAGTAFGNSDFVDLAGFEAAMIAGSGEALDTADPKRGAGQYYTYDNSAAPAGSKSGIGAGLAAAPPAPFMPDVDFSAVTGSAALEIDLTVSTIPHTDAALTDILYDVDGDENWQTVGGSTATDYTLTMATPGTKIIGLIGRSANGDSIPLATGVSVATPAAPDAMVAGVDFEATTGTGYKEIDLEILAAPDSDLAITDYEYRIGAGGSWTSMGRSTLGTETYTMAAQGTSYDFYVRAVSSAGEGADSDLDAATSQAPTSPSFIARYALGEDSDTASPSFAFSAPTQGHVLIGVLALGEPNDIDTLDGWTLIGAKFDKGDSAECAVVAKVSDGTETTFEPTLVSASRCTFNLHETRLPSGGLANIDFSTNLSGHNPPSHSPAGGNDEYAWIAWACRANGNEEYNAPPTNYSNVVSVGAASGSTGGAHLTSGSAERVATLTSDNPSGFGAALPGAGSAHGSLTLAAK